MPLLEGGGNIKFIIWWTLKTTNKTKVWCGLENWREKTIETSSEERQLLKLGARERQQIPQLGATMDRMPIKNDYQNQI